MSDLLQKLADGHHVLVQHDRDDEDGCHTRWELCHDEDGYVGPAPWRTCLNYLANGWVYSDSTWHQHGPAHRGGVAILHITALGHKVARREREAA